MKKPTLFLLFSLAFSAALPGQDYEPLVREGAVWQFFLSRANLGGDVPYGYRIDGDTLLQGQQYRKLYFLDLYAENIWEHPDDEDYFLEDEQLIGALREDTAARQVFFLDFDHPYYDSWCDSTTEQLILDFNYELGDTLQGLCTTLKKAAEEEWWPPCITDSIYTRFIWGKERRVIRCEAGTQGEHYEYLIEGIGFLKGPFAFGSHYIVVTKGGHYLHRYCAPDIAESCDLLTSITELHAQEGSLRLYPNPAQDVAQLSWQGSAPDKAEAVLCDATGREMLRVPLRLSTGHAELSLRGLPAGWYSVLVESEGERRVARLVVVR